MVSFEEAWKGQRGKATSKLKSSLTPQRQIRDKIGAAVRAMENQSRKLDTASASLQRKDRNYYDKVIRALRDHDRKRAILYANELVEVRKALRSINQGKLAMEQISLRLSTVKDVGDIVSTLAPAMSVIRSVRGAITSVVPKADEEFNNLSDILSSILVDAGQMGGLTLNFSAANMEAEKILRDAEVQVEKEMKEKLPSVPTAEREEIHL